MADTPTRFYGPAQLANTATTLFTVGAGLTAILRYIHVVNTSGTDRTFTLSVGADAAGTRLYSAITVPAGGVLTERLNVPVAAEEVVQAYASATTALTLTVAGIEVSP